MRKSVLTLLAFFTCIIANAQEIKDSSTAVQKNKLKEIGLTFSNLDSYGITYRFGNTKALWRINVMGINGSNTTSEDSSITKSPPPTDDVAYGTDSYSFTERENETYGFKIGFGREYRFPLKGKLNLRLGSGLSFRYNYAFSSANYTKLNDARKGISVNENETYNYGMNLVLGVNYAITNTIQFGFELSPSINYFKEYNYSKSTSYRTGYNWTSDEYTTNNEANNDGFYYGIANTSALLSLVFQF